MKGVKRIHWNLMRLSPYYFVVKNCIRKIPVFRYVGIACGSRVLSDATAALFLWDLWLGRDWEIPKTNFWEGIDLFGFTSWLNMFHYFLGVSPLFSITLFWLRGWRTKKLWNFYLSVFAFNAFCLFAVVFFEADLHVISCVVLLVRKSSDLPSWSFAWKWSSCFTKSFVFSTSGRFSALRRIISTIRIWS